MSDKFSKNSKSEIKKTKSGCFSCFIVLLILFFVLLFLGSVVIAKTGLIDIPIISKIFYKTPEPVRVVDVSANEIEGINVAMEKKLEDKIKEVLMQKIKDSQFTFSQEGFKLDQMAIQFDLFFTEKEVTALIKKSLISQKDMPFSDMQAVILPEEVEFFGQLEEPVKTTMTLALKPEIVQSKLNLEIKRIEIGALKIPSFLVNIMFKSLLSNKLEELNDKLISGAKLKEIVLSDGQIGISAVIDSLKQ